jgi:cytidyltransferase-like protein
MVVFTNGVFDLFHFGHLVFLERARQLGTRLVFGVNSDESARELKGPAQSEGQDSLVDVRGYSGSRARRPPKSSRTIGGRYPQRLVLPH